VIILHDGYKSQHGFSEILRQFVRPENKYAPYVFWFYDQDLHTLGIKPQEMAHELAQKGFNPGYAHARVNYAWDHIRKEQPHIHPMPQEQWLSDEWFAVMDRQARQAEADGTHACYADEWCWPSLQAGGRLAAADPSLKSKNLRFRTVDMEPGDTLDLSDCTFAAAGRVIRREQTSYVEFSHQDSWKWTRSSFDQTPPSRNNSQPLNMASAWTDDPAASCVYRMQLPAGGSYRLYACWDAWHDNTSRAVYTIGETVFTADQRSHPFRWELLGELSLPAGECAVVLTNGGEGRLWADGLKLVDEAGREIIADDHQTTNRRIAYLDSDSLAVLDGQTYTAAQPCRVYLFTLQEHRGYDGATIDYLQTRLTDLFLETSWKPSFEKLGQFMGPGKPINGIFSDHEGDYGYKLAWSEDLRRLFAEKYGEDIRRMLPLLIDRDEQGRDIVWRYRWFDTVSDIYVQHFHRLSAEAEKRDCYFTMHTWEESLQLQASCVGDVFKLNRGVSLPGTDALCSVAYNPQNFKDLFSVSEFEGVRFMNEVMALNGLDRYTPDELKKQANYLAAYGVSHVVCHAVKMTRPLAQVVVTPDFYNVDPCWQAMGQYTGFLRRTSYINSLGRANARVLLLNPLDSMYALAERDVFDMEYEMLDVRGGIPKICSSFGGEAGEINRQYGEVIRLLTRNRVEHLSADKEYLRRMTLRDGCLVYGDYAFRTVVVPRLTVLDLEVLKKLTAFARAGGQIVWITPLPTDTLQNGRNDPEAAACLAELTALPNVRLISAPEQLSLPSSVRCDEPTDNLLSHWRIIDGRHFVLLCSNSEHPASITVHLEGVRGQTLLLHPADGTMEPVNARPDGDGLTLSLTFAPYEACYVVIDPTQPRQITEPAVLIREIPLTDFTEEIDRGNAETALTHPIEPVTIDRVRVILRKGNFADPSHPDVENITLLHRGEPVLHRAVEKTCTVVYDEVAEVVLTFPRQEIDAVRITSRKGLTAYRVEIGAGEWWQTAAELDTYSQNEVIHAIDYPSGVYTLPLADWSEWDFLPDNFAGVVTYRTTFALTEADLQGNVLLELERFAGSAAVCLNGIPLGSKLFAPFRFPLKNALRAGENRLELRISNTIVSNITQKHGGIRHASLKIYS